ncbi:MAG: PaaI family thioesterase [Oceanospirillaceae bacterium]|nr:PaaI family thioesterase [Oceanospirillaceae bacterium]
MPEIAFQDAYPDDLSRCFGCGKHNNQGHQLKSYWHNEQTIAHFTPLAVHTAIPGFVYGGLIASLIDCHGTGSASAKAYQQAGRELGSSPAMRFVTGNLNVSFVAPTPIGVELELIGAFIEIKERKIVIDITLSALGVICAKGQVIAIKMPATMGIV